MFKFVYYTVSISNITLYYHFFKYVKLQKSVYLCRMWKRTNSIFCVAQHKMILQPYHTRKSTTNAEAACSKWKKVTSFAKMQYTSSNPCKPFSDIKKVQHDIHRKLNSWNFTLQVCMCFSKVVIRPLLLLLHADKKIRE